MQAVQSVSTRSELATSADSVWSLVGNFARMDTWARGATLLGVHGSGVGALRHVSTRAGNFIERCDGVDVQGRCLRYSIVESPWPISDYHAKVCVLPRDTETCLLEWSSEFLTLDHAPENFTASIELMYLGFIDKVRSVLFPI
jgi:hypothetical protein